MAFLGMVDMKAMTAETPTEGQPVDLAHLARHTLGNHDLEREVLALFLRQSAVYLDRLRDAESATERRAAAHTIKGSARGIGAWQVAEAADAVEHAAETDAAALSAALLALQATVTTTNDFIRVYMKEAG